MYSRRSRIPGQLGLIDDKAEQAPPDWANTYSCDFDGANDYVTMGDVSELNFGDGNPFSVSTWFKTSANGPVMILLSKRLTAGTRRGYEIRFRTDNDRFHFLLTNTDGSNEMNLYYQQSADEFNDGNWHHLVWTYDGSEDVSGVTLYIDNASKTPLTTIDNTLTATTDTTGPFQISGRQGANFPYNGNQDEVSMWDKELSAAEVSEIWNSGSPDNLSNHSAVANLVGWWRMGDGDTFPTLQDNSVSGNDGTMTNMAAGDIETDVP